MSVFWASAFTGLIFTLIQQQQEIKQNRIEYSQTLEAQERASKFAAAAALLEEYNKRLKINEDMLKSGAGASSEVYLSIMAENQEIIRRRDMIIKNLESVFDKKI